MAADHLQFLKDKFMADFQEAVEEFHHELPLRLHFEEMQKVLQERIIGASTPIAMKNGLYDLRHLLAECVIWAERERDRKSQKKGLHLDGWHVKKLWFLRKTGKKVLRIKKKLQRMSDDFADESFSLSGAIRVCSVWDSSWLLCPYGGQRHGLEDKLQSMRASLCQTPDDANGVKAIGIVGMGGVGKTTLARMFVDAQPTESFWPIIWVRVSKETSPFQIVTQLLETLRGLYKGNKASDPLMSMHIPPVNDVYPHPLQLREMHDLLSGKKYLIVLDNMCSMDEWYSHLDSPLQPNGTTGFNRRLCDGFPRGSGGAIIVTTRLQEVGRNMVGQKNLLKLEPTYGAEELWSMFVDSIESKEFLYQDDRQTLLRMKDEIIYRCSCLPLAAKTLAEVISIQIRKQMYWSDPFEWKTILLRIDEPDWMSFSNIIGKARTYLGVLEVDRTTNCEIKVGGYYDAVQLARDFGKYCQTELIAVQKD